jgi:hypothetical protein
MHSGPLQWFSGQCDACFYCYRWQHTQQLPALGYLRMAGQSPPWPKSSVPSIYALTVLLCQAIDLRVRPVCAVVARTSEHLLGKRELVLHIIYIDFRVEEERSLCIPH